MSYYDFDDIARFILEADERKLDLLSQLMGARREVLNAERAYVTANQVYLHDYVKTHSNLRPKKIAGVLGRITKIEGDTYSVRLEEGDSVGKTYLLKAHHFDRE